MSKNRPMTDSVIRQASLSERTAAAASKLLAGQRGGLRAYLAFVGPAVVASIAYMDPGNFATNIQAGAKYGYGLLWVVLLGNLVAVIAFCYLIEIFIAPVDWRSAALHTVLPQIADGEALLLAVGIMGATVMPHAVYLHSGLTQARIPTRDDGEKRMVVRIS